jgi:hypothetical protein
MSQKKLAFLELDLQMSHFLDGLYAADWNMLLTDTAIKKVRYKCSIDSYFQDDITSMPLTRSIVWTNAFRTHAIANEGQRNFLDILQEIAGVFDRLNLEWTIAFDM